MTLFAEETDQMEREVVREIYTTTTVEGNGCAIRATSPENAVAILLTVYGANVVAKMPRPERWPWEERGELRLLHYFMKRSSYGAEEEVTVTARAWAGGPTPLAARSSSWGPKGDQRPLALVRRRAAEKGFVLGRHVGTSRLVFVAEGPLRREP
jgi:hypothetical protein